MSGTDQLKTISDYTLVGNAFDKMARKYNDTGNIPNITTIDFKTGKAISMRDSVMLIGLPYDMRMEGKTKDFINMIWHIESGEMKPCLVEQNKLTDEPGEIEKAKIEREESSEEAQAAAARVDNGGSQSARNQRNAIERLQMNGDLPSDESESDDETDEDDPDFLQDSYPTERPQGFEVAYRAAQPISPEELDRARAGILETVLRSPNNNQR